MPITHSTSPFSMTLTSPSPEGTSLAAFAAGLGHPDHPCLSRTHNLSSCVPSTDFSPWLRERIVAHDVHAVGEYLAAVRAVNPAVSGSAEDVARHYRSVAHAIMTAPIARHLRDGSDEAYLDLRTGLVMLAVHKGFTGFIMTGEAAHFMAGIMSVHSLRLVDAAAIVDSRNRFVREAGAEMSFWAAWPELQGGTLRSLELPDTPELQGLTELLSRLALGARVHAVDALRHLSADARAPKTLASLSHYESRKRGLDVADSSRQILATGVVVPAENLRGWVSGWTRREVLRFLQHAGVPARNSWNKERMAEVALAECADLLLRRMADAGVVELAPKFAVAVGQLRKHFMRSRETWRAWLAFGTGIG
jgi:hypothetical protein